MRGLTRGIDVSFVVVWLLAEVLSEESVSETVQIGEDKEEEITVAQTFETQQQPETQVFPATGPVHEGVTQCALSEPEAAIVIQSAWRGMLARKRVAIMRGERVVKPAITQVVTETIGGTVEVSLAPQELSSREEENEAHKGQGCPGTTQCFY